MINEKTIIFERKEPDWLVQMERQFAKVEKEAEEKRKLAYPTERRLSVFHLGMALFFLLLPMLEPVLIWLIARERWLAADWIVNAEIFGLGVFCFATELYLLRNDRNLSKVSARLDETCDAIDHVIANHRYSNGEWAYSEVSCDPETETLPTPENTTAAKEAMFAFCLGIQNAQWERKLKRSVYSNKELSWYEAGIVFVILAGTCLTPMLAAYFSADGFWSIHDRIVNPVMLLLICVLTTIEYMLLRHHTIVEKNISTAECFLSRVFSEHRECRERIMRENEETRKFVPTAERKDEECETST